MVKFPVPDSQMGVPGVRRRVVCASVRDRAPRTRAAARALLQRHGRGSLAGALLAGHAVPMG